MAVALVIFARWDPLRCSGAALLFGGAGALGPALQSVGVTQGYYLFNAAPYVLTLVDHDRHLARQGRTLAGAPARAVDRANDACDDMRSRRSCRRFVAADPYPWPYDGDLRPDEHRARSSSTCRPTSAAPGGYVDTMGYDISLTRAPIEPIQRVLAAHARQGLSRSSTPAKATGPTSPTCRPTSAGARSGSAPASATRARAAASWCAASRAGRSSPSSRPLPGEPIIDKPGKGSFCATDLELILRTRGIRNIVLTGITTDVCVHTTMREANDRGFECLLLEDCCGATDHGNHLAALKMVKMQGGVFGAVATSDAASSRRCHERRRRHDAAPLTGRAPSLEAARHDQALRAASSRSTTSRSRSTPARSTRCSARTAPARPRWSNASWASTGRRAARCCSTARRSRSQTPRDARALGIGMVYQHFTLVPAHDRGREPRDLAAPTCRRVIDWARRSARARRVPATRCRSACRSTRRSPRWRPARSRSSRS